MKRLALPGLLILVLAIAGAGLGLFRTDAPSDEFDRSPEAAPATRVDPEAPALADGESEVPSEDAVRAIAETIPEPAQTGDELLASAPTSRVTIRVEDKAKTPIAGARVTLRLDGNDRSYGLFEGFEKVAPTNGDGTAVFTVPPLGAYRAFAEKKGFARGDLAPLFPGDEASVRLSPGCGIAATIVDDATGRPITGAAALVEARGPTLRADSDDQGRVRIDDLAEGVYSIEVLADGFDRARVEGVQVAPADSPPPPLEIRLAPGVSIAGNVKAAKGGEPVAEATLRYVIERRLDGKETRVLAMETRSDAAGAYRIDGVPRGIGTLQVEAETFADERVQVREPDEQDVVRIDLDLKPSVEAHGRVRDNAGGPVEGATVKLRRRNGTDGVPRGATTEADGTFALEGLGPDRQIDLYVTTKDARLAPAIVRDLVIPMDGLGAPIEVTLEPAAQLSGRVLLADGSPAVRARVVLTGIADSIWRALESAPFAFSDEGGMFRLTGLPAQTIVVRAELATARSSPVEVTLPAGGEASCELLLDRGAIARGIVVDAFGQPVESARVTLAAQVSGFDTTVAPIQAKPGPQDGRSGGPDRNDRNRNAPPPQPKPSLPSVKFGGRTVDLNEWQARDDDPRWQILGRATGGRDRAASALRGSATTDAAGRFEIQGLDPAEKLALSVRHPDHENWLEFDVVPDGAERVIALTPLIVLRGRVVDGRTYRPVEDFFVEARPIDEPPPVIKSLLDVLKLRHRRAASFVSQDGGFSLAGLSPGRWEVVVRAPSYKEARGMRFEVVRGQQAQVLVEMIPASRIRGKVVARDGTPVRRVPVLLRVQPPPGPDGKPQKPSRSDMKRTESNGKGEFSFVDLDPKAYVLSIGSLGKPIGEPVAIALGEGDLVEHVFNVGDVGGLEVEVEGLGGFGIARANVSIQGTATRVRHRARTDGAGRAAFSSLIPDDYRITVEASGYQPRSETVKVRGDDERSETVHLTAK